MVKIIDFIPESPDRISMKGLSDKIGCHPRDTRKLVLTARKSGEIIAADDRGYFIPVSNAELVSYYRDARQRAITTLVSLEPVRRYLKAQGVDLKEIEGRKA